MKIDYRPEIDGLRAIAVFSIVFYHAEIKIFRGGFLGVDMFFVISGYLITRVLLIEVESQRFSFKDFYERRSRRILPCLLLVMLVTVPIAYYLLLPNSLKEYGLSLISSVFFSSNFQFWAEDSYIAVASSLKPFLHTWSLALEEQFYILFPILIFFIFGKKRKNAHWTVFSLFLASLMLAEIFSHYHREATFYLLPFRLWELLFGTLVFLIERENFDFLKNNKLQKLLPKVGVLLLIYSINKFNHELRHPSLFTLLPVAATGIIILFASKDEFVTKFLSTNVIVFFGVMSYSLYLWHQPVFAFQKAYFDLISNFDFRFISILFIILLSLISYFLVEKKFRSKVMINDRIFYSTLLVCAFILIGVGSMFYLRGGFPERYATDLTLSSQEQFTLYQQKGQECWERPSFPLNNCRLGNEKFIILGDSHIASLIPEFIKDINTTDQGMYDLTWGQCPYHYGIDHALRGCSEINNKRDEYIAHLKNPHTFLIGFNLEQLKNAHDPKTGEKISFEESSKRVRGKISLLLAEGHKVILVKQFPPINRDTNQGILLTLLHLKSGEKFSLQLNGRGNLDDTDFLNRAYEGISENPNLLLIDPQNVFCNRNTRTCKANEGTHAYFADRVNHLSNFGARKLIDNIDFEMKKRWNESLK